MDRALAVLLLIMNACIHACMCLGYGGGHMADPCHGESTGYGRGKKRGEAGPGIEREHG